MSWLRRQGRRWRKDLGLGGRDSREAEIETSWRSGESRKQGLEGQGWHPEGSSVLAKWLRNRNRQGHDSLDFSGLDLTHREGTQEKGVGMLGAVGPEKRVEVCRFSQG